MKLLDLIVSNVRGLPDLHLQLNGKSLVIWGPNGSGKSCVVDAIEFLFSGRISRLTGEGTLGITLPQHGPHIDHKPESASVTATVKLDGFTNPVELSRSMDKPDKLICPDEAREHLFKMGELMRKGGVVLTRRDILRFVTAEAKKRADDIQTLLTLKDVEAVRASLGRAKTELSRLETAAQKAIKTAESEVNVTLGHGVFSNSGLLEAVNAARTMLGGEPIEALKSFEFKMGISPPAVRDSGSSTVNLSLLQQTVQAIREGLQPSNIQELPGTDEQLRQKIAGLKSDPGLVSELQKFDLTEHAARFVEETTVECPVCGAPWAEGHLKAHLESKLESAQTAKLMRKEIDELAEAIARPARQLKANVESLRVALMGPELGIEAEDIQNLDVWSGGLNELLQNLNSPVDLYLDGAFSLTAFTGHMISVDPGDLLDRVLSASQAALPSPT